MNSILLCREKINLRTRLQRRFAPSNRSYLYGKKGVRKQTFVVV